MSQDFSATKTAGNLLTAFTAESMARNKYSFFASAAKKEGYEEIANIFEETAANEKAHAKIWFKLLEQLGSTEFNLKSAAHGEHYEWSEMYRIFADEARSENYGDIAFLFEKAGEVEKLHQERFDQLLTTLSAGETFKKQNPIKWKCTNCGFELEGSEAPESCPLCSHPKAYFKEEKPAT